jgi:hypothetical protein
MGVTTVNVISGGSHISTVRLHITANQSFYFTDRNVTDGSTWRM